MRLVQRAALVAILASAVLADDPSAAPPSAAETPVAASSSPPAAPAEQSSTSAEVSQPTTTAEQPQSPTSTPPAPESTSPAPVPESKAVETPTSSSPPPEQSTPDAPASSDKPASTEPAHSDPPPAATSSAEQPSPTDQPASQQPTPSESPAAATPETTAPASSTQPSETKAAATNSAPASSPAASSAAEEHVTTKSGEKGKPGAGKTVLQTSMTTLTSGTETAATAAGAGSGTTTRGLTGGAIAGIVIGVCCIIAVIVLGFLFFVWRRDRRRARLNNMAIALAEEYRDSNDDAWSPITPFEANSEYRWESKSHLLLPESQTPLMSNTPLSPEYARPWSDHSYNDDPFDRERSIDFTAPPDDSMYSDAMHEASDDAAATHSTAASTVGSIYSVIDAGPPDVKVDAGPSHPEKQALLEILSQRDEEAQNTRKSKKSRGPRHDTDAGRLRTINPPKKRIDDGIV